MKRFLLAALVAVTAGACATTPKSTTDKKVDVQSEAEVALQRAEEAFLGRNYDEAAVLFEFVRANYPFLEEARTAELRLADLEFEVERLPEARERYLTFIKLHPTHPKVDYAAFRAAETYFKEIPSDFFIFPPPFEKDQGAVQSASKSMAEFLRRYPNSEHAPAAKELLLKARRQLAQHELYAAEFYEKREKWKAVVGRLETLMKQYPDVGFEEAALFGLHRAYTKLEQPEKAKEALRTLIARKPGTPAAKRAERLLGS